MSQVTRCHCIRVHPAPRRRVPGQGEGHRRRPSDYGPSVKILCEIADDPDYAGEVVTAFASLISSPKSKLRQWVEALTRRILEPGDPFDTDELKDLPCRITVTEKDTQDGPRNRVIGVMPAARRARPPRHQRQDAAPAQRQDTTRSSASPHPGEGSGARSTQPASRGQQRRPGRQEPAAEAYDEDIVGGLPEPGDDDTIPF